MRYKTLLLLILLTLLACNEQTIQPEPKPVQEIERVVIRPQPIQTHPNQRVALIIGNGAYAKKEDFLPNPPNDADDMAKVLKQVGFEVMLFKNLSFEAMEGAVQAFGEKLKKGGTGLFYFAGHGAQYQGDNYLFPIGAMRSVTTPRHLRHRTMNVGYILDTMADARNNLNVVILDACRNNPFARSLFSKRGIKTRNGLALMDVPSGTLIAYATRPNETALDSTGGRNSPYVKHLKVQLLKPGLSILKVLTNVRVAVKKETKDRQAPGFYSELDREFCFVAPCGGPVPTPVAPTPTVVAPPVAPQTPTAPMRVDRDRDGVADSEDKCPNNTSAEKAKGVYKKGSKIGCPMESDSDGVPDYRDKCPYNRPQELAQGVDKRGCPLDTDQDSVANYRDKCPKNESKEIAAGVDSQGCPLDTDQDNVADYRDNCVNNSSKEISKGVDSRGCPLDRDRDGVADYQDNCRSNARAELSQGVDSRGCPLDRDQDKVADYRDSCLGTAMGVKVKENGCPVPPTTSAGKVFRDRLKDGTLGPEMVWIPAGTFRMGDIQGGGYDNERPVHKVSITQRFAMGRYEVTFAEYDKFAEATGRKKPDDENWGRGNRPVINVSWHDGVAYTEWLSQQTGKKYRLPTEAEWEYAARGGTDTKYWWGNTASHEYANYGADGGWEGLAKGKDRWEYTAPVGSFAPNPFGIYDTVGNVWEWTCSKYENRYNGQEKTCKNKANIITSGENKSHFVLRGGSWDRDARWARTAYRNWGQPSVRNWTVGFRLARIP